MAAKTRKERPVAMRSAVAQHGLALPPAVLTALRERGIYCLPGVTVEHQQLARRHVLRGVESGGAVRDMGRTCGFLSPDGLPLPYLQSIDSITVNGRHAIFLAERFLRVEMLRIGRTFELAVTLHELSPALGRARPMLSSTMIFRGRDGLLPLDLWKAENRTLRGEVSPIFLNRAGEIQAPPSHLEYAIRRITAAVCCIGCKHIHLGIPAMESKP